MGRSLSVSSFATCAVLLFLSEVELRPHGDRRERVQVEAVKMSILEHLGLQRPPSVRERLNEEELKKMYQLYEEKLNELRRNKSAEDDHSANHKSTVCLLTSKCKYLCIFKKTFWNNAISLFCRPKLCLNIAITKYSKNKVLNTSFLQGGQHPFKKKRERERVSNTFWRLLDSKLLDVDTFSLDVGSAVQQWIASTEESLQLVLEFSPTVSVVDAPLFKEGKDQLTLEIETQENASIRSPRERRAVSSEEDCKKSDKKCCRKSQRVSFKEIGWSDWVIAPESYTMRFCDGSCPHNYKPASMHAQIKAKMHHFSNGHTPAPCCVPAAYEPMLLMHYNSEGKLTLTPFEDMIVSKCHCA
uniref:Growth/differentiation factor 15 n=1 Tax=Latimeria chalumnae TaxID=7897 RepID=H3B924_LATCH